MSEAFNATEGRPAHLRAGRRAVIQCAAVLLMAACLPSADRQDGVDPERQPQKTVPLGRYPARSGADIDCADLGYAVRVDGPDPHTLDADDDGIGCERYLGRPVPDSVRLR
ncbi:MAG TPA: hypothetical protein VEX86_07465 [Longimicrobium sp.]|nr:hypothetical protein [Longimicrobium sp.]